MGQVVTTRSIYDLMVAEQKLRLRSQLHYRDLRLKTGETWTQKTNRQMRML